MKNKASWSVESRRLCVDDALSDALQIKYQIHVLKHELLDG